MSTTPNSLEEARARVERLVEHFRTNLDAYKNSAYNETQTRREFIDPFFKALGWDVDNEAGYAPAYKDVIHEDAIKIGGFTKAPDYCFRIGGQRKFFVEAKKPFVDMKHDPVPYYQLRRYGFSAKLPLSIVTDFEELAIVDCRAKPSPNDKASTGRIRYWRYDEYLEHFEEIYNTFSKEAVLTGSFDRSIASAKTKRGTGEVDKEFLKEIESWRDELARNIARRNPGLTQRQLNEAVQVTIDRIIFLRICEDRGIEEYGVLQGMQNGANVYARLCELFQRADERYNSGLFHFKEEKNRPGHPDDLTLNLTIDDKTLKQILKGLYYPDSPYEFSVLPADILGQVYEQFLGKVIRLTAGHQAKVEDKPEVKKAGGVYYTPTYIVDYIVKNTVGKLLEGSTPKKAQMLKILDPACGSGSFLIGAYEFLLDWHRDWYTENDAEKWAQGREPRLFQGKAGWQLTTAEKKRILLNNIHGVDIDPQAVEVTKLSLLLKVLEEENQESINAQLKFFRQRALPDLSRNIKCGNSLIGTDFYEGQQMGLMDEEEQMRINPFDWDGRDGFPAIMKAGGFDAVIGNPPYIQLSMAAYFDGEVNEYLTNNYSSSMGRLNTYGLFVENILRKLLRSSGYFSFIVPNTLLTQESYQSMRLMMLQQRIDSITSYYYPVFNKAVVETIVFVLQKSDQTSNQIFLVNFDNKEMTSQQKIINQKQYLKTNKNAFLVNIDKASIGLKNRLDSFDLILKDFANINQAIALKHDRSQSLFDSAKAKNYKRVLDGRNIQRYSLSWDGWYLAYDVTKIHSCKRTDIFEMKEKIFFRRVGERLIATYDDSQFYALNTLVVITLVPQTDISLKYVLGLLNSQLMNFYYVNFLKSTKKVFSEIQARQLAQLPFRPINFSDPTDKSLHARMVELVERMLDLNKRLQASKTAHEKNTLQRQIDATDRQIDRLVYELYGLTEDEINIVEAGTSK